MFPPHVRMATGKSVFWTLMFVVLADLLAYGQMLSFAGRKDYLTSPTPQGIAVGDFNGDTFLDLAVTNTDANSVSIFLGSANGSFRFLRSVPVGPKPKAVVAVNLNPRDHNRLDLAVANSGSNNVSILYGDGTGNFTARPSVVMGSGPEALAVADLNNDMIPDLVVANTAAGTVQVALGRMDGGYNILAPVTVGTRPQSLAIGKIKGDNNFDVVVANYGTGTTAGTVTVLLGLGNGLFRTPAVTVPVGTGPRSVILADFDRDTKLDMAVANFSSKTISVFRGRGDGTFFPPQSITLASRPTALVATDFNRDQKPDIAVATLQNLDIGDIPAISILLGNGDMTFQFAPDLSPGFNTNALVIADFYRDGWPGIAATSTTGNMVSIWRGIGDGTFITDISLPVGYSPVGIASGDLNGDGIPDAVTANFGDETISVAIGVGDGSFYDAVTYMLAPPGVRLDPTGIALGDVNGDRILDIVVTNAFDNSVAVLLGNGTGGRGDGTFRPAVRYSIGTGLMATDPRAVALADMNGDAFLDIVTANFTGNSVSVLLGRGNGTFDPARVYPTDPGGGVSPRALAIVDVDFDGLPDVLTANFGSANVSVLRGIGMGMLSPPVNYSVSACGQGPHGIAVNDFNGDGFWDIAVSTAGTYDVANDKVAVLLGRPDVWGTFQAPTCRQVGMGPTGTVSADFNYDGIPDIAVVNGLSNSVAVLLGVGDGTFRPAEFYGVGAGPIFMAVDDFYYDGIPDLGVVNATSNTVSVLVNTTR